MENQMAENQRVHFTYKPKCGGYARVAVNRGADNQGITVHQSTCFDVMSVPQNLICLLYTSDAADE